MKSTPTAYVANREDELRTRALHYAVSRSSDLSPLQTTLDRADKFFQFLMGKDPFPLIKTKSAKAQVSGSGLAPGLSPADMARIKRGVPKKTSKKAKK